MTEKNRYTTLKIIIGYLFIVIVAIFSVMYIYDITKEVAKEEEPDHTSRTRIYLVTNTLSLVYESEALGQLFTPANGNYNQLLNNARLNMDSLKVLTTDSIQLLKIDTINSLLERKRINTRSLLEAIHESSPERLYARNIDRVIAIRDTVTVELEKEVEIQQDTVFLPGKKRNFFQRLANVFAPSSGDTNVVVTSSRQVLSDTLYFDPSEKISNVLKDIQDSVTYQQQGAYNLVLSKVKNLNTNNNVITAKINQLLRDMEEEEMNASFARTVNKQELLRETTRILIGVISLVIGIMIFFLYVITRDISKSRYYRQKLEKANRYAEDLLQAREKLMLMMSHDIRAPLSSITGYIDLFEGLNPNERQKYYLENMKVSAQHILSLINNLLDSYRLESGRMEVHAVPTDLRVLFQEIHSGFNPIAERKELQCILNFEEDYSLLYLLDPILVRQITGNLLSNAIKFTEKGQVALNISVEKKNEKEHRLNISVMDTGPGIKDNEKEKIFAEFERLSRTEQVEGFGLGLSIAFRLTRLLKGQLSVDSTFGKGSEFKVTLPMRMAPVSISEKDTSETKNKKVKIHSQGTIHCLLVDDDPVQLALTQEVLIQMNVKVSTCSYPEKILDLLHNEVFDIILTDIQMPQVDGYKLLEMIRKSGIPKTNRLPVVALSANMENNKEFYKDAGFSGFLNKPYTTQELLDLFKEILHVEIITESDLNFSSLTAFAGDDKISSVSILKTFSEETEKNISLLEAYLLENKIQPASETVHKMLPTFSMLEHKEITDRLRIIENGSDQLSLNEWKEEMNNLIFQLKVVSKEINRFIIEFMKDS
ncbi:MAG: ATP-binding protein [Candidatus Azobacteroides sp.]|nr:ATP-binding protein [Candidatus Azobacteroides sp.]